MSAPSHAPASHDGSLPTARRRRKRKLLITAAALLCGLAGAEGAFRLRLSAHGTPYSATATKSALRGMVHAMLSRRANAVSAPRSSQVPEGGFHEVHPYFGFEEPGVAAELQRESEYFATPEAERNFDLLVLGGSVAEGFVAFGAQTLAQALQASPLLEGREVRIQNRSHVTYKQPQQVNVLTLLFCLGYRPDCVLEIDGLNEVAIANANAGTGTHPLYPGAGQWAPLVSGSRLDRTALDCLLDMRACERAAARLEERWTRYGLFASALTGRLGLNLAHDLRRESVALQERLVAALQAADELSALRGPAFDPQPEAVMARCVDGWFEGSLSLAGLCRAREILYVHALQPNLHDADSKPLTESERLVQDQRAWADGVLRGYPLLREKGAELTARGVRFVDCSMLFRERTEELYSDCCHLVPAGQRLLAETLAASVLDGLAAQGSLADGR